MKQKIKKLAYTIPLDSDYIHDANIVVAKIHVPSKKRQKNKQQFPSHSISMMIQKTLLTPNGKSSFPNEKSKNCVKP